MPGSERHAAATAVRYQLFEGKPAAWPATPDAMWAQLADRRLGPPAGQPPPRRARLLEFLRSYVLFGRKVNGKIVAATSSSSASGAAGAAIQQVRPDSGRGAAWCSTCRLRQRASIVFLLGALLLVVWMRWPSAAVVVSTAWIWKNNSPRNFISGGGAFGSAIASPG